MDDIFGTKPKTPLEEAWHTEQRRKQFDIIRVANPREVTVKGILYVLPHNDFYVQYDVNQFQKIEFGTTKDMPRDRAERYIHHKKDEIINYIAQKLHDEYILERDKKGLPRYQDKYTENKETYETQNYPKTDDPSLIAELYNQLWVGLVLKAASDIPPSSDARSGEVDLTSPETKALESLANKRVDIDSPPPEAVSYTPSYSPPAAPVSSFSSLNQRLTPSEVTKEDL